MNLHDFLHIQKDAVDTGHLIPCITDPEPDTWFDGDHERATRLCNQCPIRQACADYARTNREPHGTWGGVWRNDKKPLAWKPRRAPLTQDERATATRLLTEGDTYAAIADRLGCTLNQIQEHARRTKHTKQGVPPEVRDIVIKLRTDGLTYRQIGTQLGISARQAETVGRTAARQAARTAQRDTAA